MQKLQIPEWLVPVIDWIKSLKRLNARLSKCEARLDALETKELSIKQKGPITIEEIDYAHELVRNAYKPEVFNPKSYTNMDYVKVKAYEYIFILRTRLIDKNIDSSPPTQLDVENKDSLAEWYKYLLRLRAKFRAGSTVQISKVKRNSSTN